MTQNSEARTNFAANIKKLLTDKNFDGLDLDLEGGWGPDAPFYSDEYTLLAKELRDSLGSDFYLTAAVGATPNSWDGKTLWTREFVEVLDWINIMVYDLHLWSANDIYNPSGFNDQVNVAETWEEYLGKEKLVFGVPFYSNGWDYDNNKRYANQINWYHAPNNTDSASWDWYENNVFNYFVLDSLFDLNPDDDSIIVGKDDKIWIDVEGSVMGFRGSHNGIIYLNGRTTMKKKAKWAIDNEYGGIMIWELSCDVPTTHPNSLLNALAEQFYESTKGMSIPIAAKNAKFAKNEISFSIRSRTLKITLENANPSKVIITDSKGRVLFSQSNGTKEILISMAKKYFAAGIYTVTVSQDNTAKSVNFMLK
jgi:GH18 family chitinase